MKKQYNGLKTEVRAISSSVIKISVSVTQKKELLKVIQIVNPNDIEEELEDFAEYENGLSTSRLNLFWKDGLLNIQTKEGDILCKDFSPPDFFDKKLHIRKSMMPDEHFFGFGEKMGFLNKRGTKMEMYNKDNPIHFPDADPLYISIPFFISIIPSGPAYGILIENTEPCGFDMGYSSEEWYEFWVQAPRIEYWMIYGKDVKDVVQKMAQLTGKMELPPAWALGYQQSRWSYSSQDEVINVAKKMREEKIPCDVIHLDIGYMDGYKIFTWDKARFPEPKRLISELRNMGIKVVTIIDPGVKKEPGYQVYNGLKNIDGICKQENGEDFIGYVWPGKCVFPDFLRSDVREFWTALHKELLESGVAGIWNDMNEPSIPWLDGSEDKILELLQKESFMDKLEAKQVFDQDDFGSLFFHRDNEGNIYPHQRIRNVYALLEARATKKAFEKFLPDRRPFILTRAGFTGIQRYAAVWTGDNSSWWEHLLVEIKRCLNLSLSGVSFVGTDVGGFGGNATSELLIRWTEMGIFFPFFRNHSALNTRHQEPWAFDKKTESIIRETIRKRYEFFPYLYTQFWKSSTTGIPIMKPLFFADEMDSRTYYTEDEFLIGDLLVAPVYSPNTYSRSVYLPRGKWVDIRNDTIYDGKTMIDASAPLNEIPVYVKMDSIISRMEIMDYIFEREKMSLILDIYVQDKAHIEVYEDDGETYAYRNGEYNIFNINVERKEDEFTVKFLENPSGFTSRYDALLLRFHLCTGRCKVNLNDNIYETEAQNGIAQVRVDL